MKTAQQLAKEFLEELEATKSFTRRWELIQEWFKKNLRLKLEQRDNENDRLKRFNIK